MRVRPGARKAPSEAPQITRHGMLKVGNPFLTALKFVSAALAVVLVSGTVVGGIFLAQLNNDITSVPLVGESEGPPPALGSYEGGFNVLIVGSDVCEDDSGCDGRGAAELNDVTILLHVSHDQTNAVAVSIPRDMVVPIPACPRADGKGKYSAMAGRPINETLSYGGLPCTVLTVSTLTGLDIPFAAEVKFSGVINISTAIGGVPVCIAGPMRDSFTGFTVPAAGEYPLSGHDALMFLRSRHGVGDGGDLGRISSQQQFLSSMIRKLKAPGGALGDPIALLKIATVVSKNTIVSNSLKNLNTMVSMAEVLKKLQLDKVVFVQYPAVTGQSGLYAGKVAPVAATAAALFAKIKADEPFTPAKPGLGAKLDASAPAVPGASAPSDAADAPSEVLPGIEGQSAADNTCTKPFGT